MHYARTRDFSGEELTLMPDNASTSLQAVTEVLGRAKRPLTPDDVIEGLFDRGYAVLPIEMLQANQIFKGHQA